MKKLGIWLLNNLKWIFAVIVLAVTGIVITNTMVGSYNSYKAYEIAYNENDLEVRSNSAAAPKYIEIDDDFKSEYFNTLELGIGVMEITTTQEEYVIDDEYVDLSEKGGTIALSLTLEEKSFLDIDFILSSVVETTSDDETIYGTKDLLSNVDFVVNGETMEEDIDLENSGDGVEWHHLIMSGFALPAGDVTISIKSNSGKASYMPQLSGINLFSSQPLTLVTE